MIALKDAPAVQRTSSLFFKGGLLEERSVQMMPPQHGVAAAKTQKRMLIV
jgi:hypothetical protein